VGRSLGGSSVRRRISAALVLAAVALIVSGCSAERVDQWGRGGLPEPAAEQSGLVEDFWVGTWIAALAVGGIMWGLILWAAFRYRKRSDHLPPQVRYNLPIEALYTITPLFVIGVLFTFTVDYQNELFEPYDEEADHSVEVIGQQWSWTFNYLDEEVSVVGTTTEQPTLVLPVDQTVEFELTSPDVVHSFWVPAFYMKQDIVPGEDNVLQVTPDREGTFAGRCAEMCGAYHNRMLFDVEIVSQDEYDAYIAELREDPEQQGIVDVPLRGSYENEAAGEAEQ